MTGDRFAFAEGEAAPAVTNPGRHHHLCNGYAFLSPSWIHKKCLPPITIMASYPKTRQSGAHRSQVSAPGFGAMGLSLFYGTVFLDDECIAMLDRVDELGQMF